MTERPMPLQRPLLILGEFADPGVGSLLVARRFGKITADDGIATVALPLGAIMDQCRQLVVEKVEQRFGGPDRHATIEVDVIGISMGGVIARYAALGSYRHRIQLLLRSSDFAPGGFSP